jgi:hypothetical protein
MVKNNIYKTNTYDTHNKNNTNIIQIQIQIYIYNNKTIQTI